MKRVLQDILIGVVLLVFVLLAFDLYYKEFFNPVGRYAVIDSTSTYVILLDTTTGKPLIKDYRALYGSISKTKPSSIVAKSNSVTKPPSEQKTTLDSETYKMLEELYNSIHE